MEFWREKNANAFLGKFEVKEATEEEKREQLILKLRKKLDKINILFDEDALQKYIKNDKKHNTGKAKNLSERELKQKIGLRLLVDLTQLARDFSQYYGLSLPNCEVNLQEPLTLTETTEKLEKGYKLFSSGHEILKAINLLREGSYGLALLLKFDLVEVEREREKIEEKEGNFLSGKFVLIKEKK